MRVIFAGTPVFASQALAALVAAGHQVVLVLTRADKPAGRGQKLVPSPVKLLAQNHGLPVFQPTSLRDEGARAVLAQAQADVMVVAAYGMILPPAVLALPRLGCLNIHGSLLPRWRGAAPIQRAIEAGDTETGITIMQMDAGLDTGPMLLARAIPIDAEESSASLHDRLADLGAELIVQALADLPAGRLRAQVQPQEGVTYAHKILKAEAAIDWRADARPIVDRIRAFDPFPGCVGWLRPAGKAGEGAAEPVKIWQARQVPAGAADGLGCGGDEAAPGTITAVGPQGLRVACGRGSVELLSLQRPGGRRLPVAQWLQSGSPVVGACFEPPPAESAARVS